MHAGTMKAAASPDAGFPEAAPHTEQASEPESIGDPHLGQNMSSHLLAERFHGGAAPLPGSDGLGDVKNLMPRTAHPTG